MHQMYMIYFFIDVHYTSLIIKGRNCHATLGNNMGNCEGNMTVNYTLSIYQSWTDIYIYTVIACFDFNILFEVGFVSPHFLSILIVFSILIVITHPILWPKQIRLEDKQINVARLQSILCNLPQKLCQWFGCFFPMLNTILIIHGLYYVFC